MSAFNASTCEAITSLLAGRVFKCAEIEGDALVLRCEDGALVRVALGATVTGEAPVRLPAPLAGLLGLAQAEHEAQKASAKPPAQRVAIGGIDATHIGFGKNGGAVASGVNWRAVVALPAFQEFARSSGFPAAPGVDDDEWAAQFVMSRAEAGQNEGDFFDEYARWFESTGRWPNELPTGGLRA